MKRQRQPDEPRERRSNVRTVYTSAASSPPTPRPKPAPPAPRPRLADKVTAIIDQYDPARKFGFLFVPYGDRLFFHFKDYKGPAEDLRVGLTVTCGVVESRYRGSLARPRNEAVEIMVADEQLATPMACTVLDRDPVRRTGWLKPDGMDERVYFYNGDNDYELGARVMAQVFSARLGPRATTDVKRIA